MTDSGRNGLAGPLQLGINAGATRSRRTENFRTKALAFTVRQQPAATTRPVARVGLRMCPGPGRSGAANREGGE